MTQIYANNFTTLALGRQGENLARQVVFDIRDLESLYGSGTVEVIYQRPGDELPYPVAVQREGTTFTWNVTATDTEMPGNYGECELRYYVGETLAKSKIWRTWVEPAMDTPSETEPPEPEQGWVDQIISVGAAAQASADAAKADADRAAALYQEMQTWAHGVIQDVNTAGSAAVQSAQSTGDAQVQRVAAEGATQTANAKAQADAAAQSASGAARSAQEAAGSASAASTSEANAKASEEATKASETAAKASETTAKSEADRAKREADRAAGVKPKCVTVTLSSTGWESTAKTQTVAVSGVSATETDQMITPTPALASQAAYYEAGILCTGQAADSLTFTCKTVPTADLTVYVVIQEVTQG